MKAKLLSAVVVFWLVSPAAHAHDCSGGADGGMDATGNQCNREIAATPDSSDRAASTRTTKLDARKPHRAAGVQPRARAKGETRRLGGHHAT